VLVCGGAFLKGGREEQLASGAVLLAWALTIGLRDRNWVGTQWGAFIADGGLLLVFIVLALRTPRYWPLAAAGFQLLTVVTHAARMIDPGVRAWAYATGQVIWSQMVIVALGVGVWNTWRASLRQPDIGADLTADPGAPLR